MNGSSDRFLALSGGIGGAKLALGLSHVLEKTQLTVIANTGDDFEHFGLYISPDVDTLIYTLADINNTKLGWGRRDETWNFMDACGEVGLDTWFRLGDRDLAVHLYRSNRLKQGATLSDIVRELCAGFSVRSEIIPMSDHPVRTIVETDSGILPFQEYFVKHRCKPRVAAIHFEGIDEAMPAPGFLKRLQDPGLRAIIICPSNPFLSVHPILSLPGIKQDFKTGVRPVIVVSPIVQGQALKGPTTKLMRELKLETDVVTIAGIYKDIADAVVIDTQDTEFTQEIESMGITVHTANIVMRTLQDRINLAKDVVKFAHDLSH